MQPDFTHLLKAPASVTVYLGYYNNTKHSVTLRPRKAEEGRLTVLGKLVMKTLTDAVACKGLLPVSPAAPGSRDPRVEKRWERSPGFLGRC